MSQDTTFKLETGCTYICQLKGSIGVYEYDAPHSWFHGGTPLLDYNRQPTEPDIVFGPLNARAHAKYLLTLGAPMKLRDDRTPVLV